MTRDSPSTRTHARDGPTLVLVLFDDEVGIGEGGDLRQNG